MISRIKNKFSQAISKHRGQKVSPTPNACNAQGRNRPSSTRAEADAESAAATACDVYSDHADKSDPPAASEGERSIHSSTRVVRGWGSPWRRPNEAQVSFASDEEPGKG